MKRPTEGTSLLYFFSFAFSVCLSCSVTNFDVLSTRSVGFTDPNHEDIEIFPTLGEKKATEGILVMDKTKWAKIVCESELLLNLGVQEHSLRLSYCCLL